MATMDSRLPEVLDRLARAQAAGLSAAARVLQAEVRRRLAGGYTSGRFVTGRVLNSVTVVGPTVEGPEMTIRVGSPLNYALFWELGHRNVFTRRFERQERWLPAFWDSWEDQQAAFAAAWSAAAQGQAPPPLGNALEFSAGPSTGPSAEFPPGAPSRPYGRSP